MSISYNVTSEIVGSEPDTCGATFNMLVTVTPSLSTTTVGDQTFPESTVTVMSTVGFPTSGTLAVYNGGVVQAVGYTGTTTNTFTGCSFFSGTYSIPSGSIVYQSPTLTVANPNPLDTPFTLPQTFMTVFSTTGFPTGGGSLIVYSSAGPQVVTYTSLTSTQFLGCAGGTGTVTSFDDIILNPVPLGVAEIGNSYALPSAGASGILVDSGDGYSYSIISMGPLYTGQYILTAAAYSGAPQDIEYGVAPNLPLFTIPSLYNTVTTITGFSSNYLVDADPNITYVANAGNYTCTNQNTIQETAITPSISVSVNVANADIDGPVPAYGTVVLYTEGQIIMGNGSGGSVDINAEGNGTIVMEALPSGNYYLQAVYNPASGFSQNTNCFAPSVSVMGAPPWGIMHTIEPQYPILTISPGYTGTIVHGQPFSMTVNIYRNNSPCNMSGSLDFSLTMEGISSNPFASLEVTACNISYSLYPGDHNIVILSDPGSPGGGPDPITLSIEVPSWPDSLSLEFGAVNVIYGGGCWTRTTNGEIDSGLITIPVTSVGSENTGYTPQV